MIIIGDDGVDRVINDCSVKEYLSSNFEDYNDFTNYTTMRMLGRTGRIPEFEIHLERLKIKGKEEELKVEAALKELNKKYPIDLRVTFLIKNQPAEEEVEEAEAGEKEKKFLILAEEMPIAEVEKSCQVEIRRGYRKNVTEKSFEWMKERKGLEGEMDEESDEVILCDEEGNLYEGLSSNFFVMRMDGRLQTAPLNCVLTGTVMKRLLTEEDLNEMEVIFEFPNVEEIENWRGAFITSTSRLILPIYKILIPEKGKAKEFVIDERLKRLRRKFIFELN